MSLITVIMPGPERLFKNFDTELVCVRYPELWKPIRHYEGMYEISNFGRYRNAKGRVMKFVKNNLGYMRAELSKKGEKKRFMIHRLVAREFIGPVPGYTMKEVNHIDGVKKNNFVKNLEWTTKSENHSHRHHDLGKNNFTPKRGLLDDDTEDDFGPEFDALVHAQEN